MKRSSFIHRRHSHFEAARPRNLVFKSEISPPDLIGGRDGVSPAGFTLVEITVVVAIFAIILAIALPQFSKMMMIGNETSAIEAMRAVTQAIESWKLGLPMSPDTSRQAALRVPARLSDLVAADPPYLDARFRLLGARNSWRGYRFSYAPAGGRSIPVGNQRFTFVDRFVMTADPLVRGLTGQRSFFVDDTGVIRYNTSRSAGSGDPALEQMGGTQ